MFGRLILVSASVIAMTAAANAADLNRGPSAESYKDTPHYGVTWNGFYIGANGGYGWDVSNIADEMGPLGASPEGGFGGGQIGFNFQRGNFVFGVEADLQAAGISDSQSLAVGPMTIENKSSLDWFGTVRGRLGVALDRTLIYGTGGFAFGGITDETSCSVAAGAQMRCALGYGTHETDTTGFVLGGGVEHKFNAAWSLKVEYQYMNLGQDSYFADRVNQDFEVSTIRVGLNYHFGGGHQPLK